MSIDFYRAAAMQPQYFDKLLSVSPSICLYASALVLAKSGKEMGDNILRIL